MKKIVIVSSIQIFPALSGGQLRTANLALALADLGYEVCIYSLTGRKNDYVTFKKSSTEIISSQISEFVNRSLFFGLIQKIFYICKFPPIWIYWILKFLVFLSILMLRYKGSFLTASNGVVNLIKTGINTRRGIVKLRARSSNIATICLFVF